MSYIPVIHIAQTGSFARGELPGRRLSVEPEGRRIGLVGRLFGSHVPNAGAGRRTRLSGVLDTLVLGLAVAAPGESGEIFDSEYAEAMVLVFDEYFRRQSLNRQAVWASDVRAESVPQGIHDESFAC